MSRAGVDVELVQLGLLGAHVLERADDRAELGVQRLVGQPRAGRLGHAEVDDLRDRLAVVQGDQDVGRLEVAVDDRPSGGRAARPGRPGWPARVARGSSAGCSSQNLVIGMPLTSSMTK